MAAIITINGTMTLDESLGLQNTGIAVGSEDNNDSDVALSTLQTGALAFYNRLFNSAGSGGLALSTTFPSNIGVAESPSNFIAVSGGTVTALGFVDGNGGALPVYSSGVNPLTGVLAPLTADTGGAIHLFADATLGNRMVLGVDTTGDIVFAIYMDPNAALTGARVWMVQFEPIFDPDTTNPDHSQNLFDSIGVAASTVLDFNFNALPSGQNLFGTVGTTDSAIVVIGKTPILNADGTFTNASNTINTSQGGGAVTIGVNNQMFDAGEGAYFTYVKNPVPNFLAGAPNGLDQNEADQAANIQYTGGTLESTGAFAKISQIQGNSPATMKITAYDIAGAPQGTAFVSGLGTGTQVDITSVRVFDATGAKIEDTADLAHFNSASVVVTFASGVATVSGLGAGYKIDWTTSAVHDRVLIEDVAGKFDIGGFGISQTSATAVDIGQQLTFEDDGPSIAASIAGAPTLIVDESVLTTDATGSFAAQFTPTFGTDGQGATPVTYALSTPGGDSGLIDTASNNHVFLFLESGQVVGREGTDATAAAAGPIEFVVSVNSSGVVTLDQQRAIVHPDTTNPDDSKSLSAANLVVLTATATDGDGDHASVPLNIGQQLVFKDDGPSITASATNAPTLTVDESALATNVTAGFAGQFTPVSGADGPGATAVSYALSTPGGASGLTDTATGESVVLSLVGGQILGKTATTSLTVFVVSVDASGNVTLDQQRAIVHTNPNDPDESRGLTGSNLVVLNATATDRDGDHAPAPLDLTSLLVFKDDGPSIGPIANSIVDFAINATATQNLHGVVGADPNSAPYIISNFTNNLTINGTELHGVASNSNETITYYADTNHDTIFGNAGDTAFYQLSLNETADSGAGSYTFTVLVAPPPANLNFTFDALPSGQNLFGTVGTTDTAIIVIGQHPILNPDGTFSNASDTINTSQGGGATTIGVDNQMFDAGEGAYFTYVKSPVANFLSGAPNGLDQNEADQAANIQYTGGTLEVTSAFAKISQIQGNSLATMKITAYDIAGAPQGTAFVSGLGTGTPVSIASVRVFDATGAKVEDTGDLAHFNSPSVGVSFTAGVATVSGLGAGYKIEWTTSAVHDRVLIADVAGKFDIGGFGINQPQPTPDQKLDFVAKVTDGDGDFATSAFSIGIDGTGINHDGHVAGVLV